MTNYLVNEKGIRTTISDDLFDVLWQSIDGDDKPLTTAPESEVKPKRKENI